MDKETRQWYENQFDLFGEEGWKALIEQAKDMQETYNTVLDVTTEATLYHRKGQLDILNWLLEWEGVVNRTFKEIDDEQSQTL